MIYGIKEVMNLDIFKFNPDIKKAEPLAYIDYAQATGLEHSANRTEVRGGWGNALLVTFDDTKTASMTLTLPLVDMRLLTAITGDEYLEEQGVYKRRDVSLVKDGGTGHYIVLSREPLNDSLFVNILKDEVEGKSLEVIERGNTSPASDKCSIVIEQDEVRLYMNKADAPLDTEVVARYSYLTTSKLGTFSYQASTSPKPISMSGVAKFRNKVTGVDELFDFTGYKMQFRQDYNITFSATDVTTLELTVDFYLYRDKETNKEAYYKISKLDEENPEGTITLTNITGNTLNIKTAEKFTITTKEENVTVESATSNNSKFTVKGNEITGVAAGNGKITLKKWGYADKEITVTVTQA